MLTGLCGWAGNDMLITPTPRTTASGPGRPSERLCCDFVKGPGFKSLPCYV